MAPAPKKWGRGHHGFVNTSNERKEAESAGQNFLKRSTVDTDIEVLGDKFTVTVTVFFTHGGPELHFLAVFILYYVHYCRRYATNSGHYKIPQVRGCAATNQD